MADLNVMLLEHAKAGLQTQLDTAVTNGDTEAARKAADEIAKLSAATAPKPSAYGDTEIRAALEAKAEWFGTDPRKSGAAVRLGKDMNPKKFASADAFAEALIKAVNEEFKPAVTPKEEDDDETVDDGDDKEDEDDKDDKAKKPARRSDGPSDADAGSVRTRRTSGPWTKLSDAPPEVRKDIERTADKWAPKTKEGREKYVAKALESQYQRYQIGKGKR